MTAIEALAEAWASIDGRLAAFRACKADPAREDVEGRHAGYMAESAEMIRRLQARGYILLPADAAPGS